MWPDKLAQQIEEKIDEGESYTIVVSGFDLKMMLFGAIELAHAQIPEKILESLDNPEDDIARLLQAVSIEYKRPQDV